MRLAKGLGLACSVLLLPALTGCASYEEYLMRSQKPNLNAFTDTRYQVTNYQVVGLVKAKVEASSVLGIVLDGTDGAGALWQDADEKYRGQVTGIKDVTAVSEFYGILPPVYTRVKTTYYGVAIRDMAVAAPMPSMAPAPLVPGPVRTP